jgi:hypothetical protein
MARLSPTEHRRIVVAFADSEESMHATAVAAQLVAQRGELVFVHVVEVPLEFTLDEPPPPGEAAMDRHATSCSRDARRSPSGTASRASACSSAATRPGRRSSRQPSRPARA